MAAASLPAQTTLGPAHLIVSDLDRSVEFYTKVLGFTLGAREGDTAHLMIADNPEPVLLLTAVQGARPKPLRSTGLYHVAILLPDRTELAHALRRLVQAEYPLQGASDHLVSEALYLADPDGNGLEIYRDRPREEWQYRPDGQIEMDTLPLDLQSLLRESVAEEQARPRMGSGTKVGHVHLHVAHLAPAVAFYRDVIGFDVMVGYIPTAAFLSAGGYHHHLALNTWAGVGAPQPPANAVGIRVFDVDLPADDALAAIVSRLRDARVAFEEQPDGAILTHDPSGNAVRLVVMHA